MTSPTLKPMPPASVLYAVTFDPQGRPVVQGAAHTDTAGRVSFQGDAGKTYGLLHEALPAIARRFAESLTEQLVKTVEEKRLLNAQITTTPLPPASSTPLVSAGDAF